MKKMSLMHAQNDIPTVRSRFSIAFIRNNFYNNSERNLVTTGANQLKVYRLIRDGGTSGSSTGTGTNAGSKRQKASQQSAPVTENKNKENDDHGGGH